MDYVIDAGNSWPCTVSGITETQITAVMAGENGLNAVCTGPARLGVVVVGGNHYQVTLPGAFSELTVTFRRA